MGNFEGEGSWGGVQNILSKCGTALSALFAQGVLASPPPAPHTPCKDWCIYSILLLTAASGVTASCCRYAGKEQRVGTWPSGGAVASGRVGKMEGGGQEGVGVGVGRQGPVGCSAKGHQKVLSHTTDSSTSRQCGKWACDTSGRAHCTFP